MRWQWSLSIMVVMGSRAMAQEAVSVAPGSTAPIFATGEITGAPVMMDPGDGAPRADSGFLTGTHKFPNFIGFLGNPLQSIDPRSLTAIYPLFGSVWTSADAPIPSASAQVYGPALTVALSDRLSVGLNQGGYAVATLSRNQFPRLAQLDLAGRFRDVERGGDRSGFLNLGGFIQYTVIQDEADQFLVTGGVRWEAPAGSHEIFQGHGPMHLAPYVTLGKEFGNYHLLATAGYLFPAGPGNDTTNAFNVNVHLDRRTFGWLYPLVEVGSTFQTKSVKFGLDTRRGYIDFGTFESEGDIVTLGVGANAVLIPERLEFGAIYTTSLSAQHGLDINGLLVKMTLRY